MTTARPARCPCSEGALLESPTVLDQATGSLGCPSLIPKRVTGNRRHQPSYSPKPGRGAASPARALASPAAPVSLAEWTRGRSQADHRAGFRVAIGKRIAVIGAN